MGHGITKSDNFAFTGERSRIWHGIGQEIPDGQTAEETFPQIGLGWDTELVEPVYAYNGNTIRMPEHRVHIRKDTGDMLGIVSNNYKKVDNSDLARFADSLVLADDGIGKLTVETAGSLLGGKRVFCLLRLPEEVRVGLKGNDRSEMFVCLSNGHGGFASLAGSLTAVRVVCANTIALADRDLAAGFRFSHNGDLDAKIKQARLILGFARKEAKLFNEQAKALDQTDLSTGQLRDFLELAFTRTFGKAPDATEESEAAENWRKKRDEHIADWVARFENERQTLPGIQGTAWAAFNAYSEWSDHDRGGNWMKGRPADHRVHSNLFGVANAAKKKVLRDALALAR
jgi:phage/plasmid-like protein (TIGR03299 family)